MTHEEKVILVLCPIWGVKYPSIGLGYLSEYLRSKRIDTEILDFNIEIYNQAAVKQKRYWDLKTNFVWEEKDFLKKYLEECFEKIISLESNIIAFSVMASNAEFTSRLIKKIKKEHSEKIIITGGLQDTKHYTKAVDYHIEGEGEETLYRLIKVLDHNKNIEDEKGLIFDNKKKTVRLRKKEYLDINSLPCPTYKGFNLESYESNTLGILASKGCINRCAFCNDWPVWGSYQYRKAENIFEEIKFHYENNKVDDFEFFDLLINGNLRELEKFSDYIIESDMKVHWRGNAIIRKDMDKNLLKKMRSAGCTHLVFGAESGSDKIIKKMGKKFTSEDTKKVIKNTHKSGIEVVLNLMVGFPGETEKDFKKTLKFVKDNKEYIDVIAGISTCFSIQNSLLHEKPERYGIDITMDNSIYRWKDKEGNDYKERMRRVRKLNKLLKSLRIPVCEVKAVEESPQPVKGYESKNKNLIRKFFQSLTNNGILHTLKNIIAYFIDMITK